MVGTLSCFGVHLGWVTDDAIGWFICGDLDFLYVFEVASVQDGFGILADQVDQAVDGACTLVLIQSKFEVHAHDSEVFAGVGKDQVEGRFVVACGWFKLSEQRLWVSKDVLWPNESSHGSVHGLDGHFGAQCCTSTFAVG